jgi:hypothetical protein
MAQGGFAPAFRLCEDYELWLRLLHSYIVLAQILLSIIPGGEILQSIVDIAHTRRTEAISSTRMLHRHTVIECHLKNRFACRSLHLLHLAIAGDETHVRHERSLAPSSSSLKRKTMVA